MKRAAELLPGVAAAALALFSFWLGLFSGPEHFFEDILFSSQPARGDIVIVAVDNKSLTEIGQWPWRRSEFSDFLTRLEKAPPRAVAIDVIFAEPSRYGEADDAALALALRSPPFRVVMPVEADPLAIENGIATADALVVPRAIFAGPNVTLGHVSLITDPDGVVRRVPRGMKGPDGATIPAFSAFATDKENQSLALERIAYIGPPGSIRRVSFVDALRDETVRASLAGKYVFLGSTAPDLHDEQLTPVSKGVPMPGVEIQAQIAQMFLNGVQISALGRPAVSLWILIAALLPALVFMLARRTRNALVISVALGFAHIPVAIVLFERGVIGNILHVNIAWLFGIAAAFAFRYYVRDKERRDMRHVFSKYVSKDVLEEILRDTSKVKLGGEEKEATVFFSDIRGFTTLSEKLTPVELTQFLNRYLTRMTNIALERRGVVDKYIGDAIMVFWGAPLANLNHALDAMETSLAMIEDLMQFNRESALAGDPPIDIGIGFNSGKVVAGNMGSEQRFDYTVMGDTVNLASRLEGQTKTYGIHIITSEFTMALVAPEALASRGILARELDRIRVKGKKLPVTIYEVVERGNTERVRRVMPQFDALRAAYYNGEWKRAMELGASILARVEDKPTKVLRERAEHFLHEPPEQWDGVYEMKTK